MPWLVEPIKPCTGQRNRDATALAVQRKVSNNTVVISVAYGAADLNQLNWGYEAEFFTVNTNCPVAGSAAVDVAGICYNRMDWS